MRRWGSIILFVIGGFCVGMQVMIGFMKIPPDYPRDMPPIILFTAVAALFLIPATWLSPARRWRELGMTMLIGAGVCLGSFAVTLAAPPEDGGVGGTAQLEGYVDWAQGWTNVVLIVTAGLAMMFMKGREWA